MYGEKNCSSTYCSTSYCAFHIQFWTKCAVKYDTLANHEQYGLYTVSLFETIRDKEKLNEYFLKINYDTLKISKKPDFDSVMVIAVVTEYTGGNAYYHKIERITEGTDSIIVDIHYDSLIYNLKVQQVYTILLLTIPRSDKPVFFRENIVTSAQKPLGRNVAGMISERLAANANRVYDIN